MIEIKRLPEFDEWLDGIIDIMTRIRLNRRLDKVQRGNWGDIKPLQDIMDVYEIMEFVLGNLYGNVQNTLQKAQLINQKKGPLTRQERKSLGS